MNPPAALRWAALAALLASSQAVGTGIAVIQTMFRTPMFLDTVPHAPLYLLSQNGSVFAVGTIGSIDPITQQFNDTVTGLVWKGQPERTWSIVANEPLVARDEAAASVVGPTLLLAGGRCLLTPTCPPVISWDGIIWAALPPLPFPLLGAGAAVLGNRVYLVGGTALNATGGIMTNVTGVVVSVPGPSGQAWDIAGWVEAGAVTNNGTYAPFVARRLQTVLTSYSVAQGMGWVQLDGASADVQPALVVVSGLNATGNNSIYTDAWVMASVDWSANSTACPDGTGPCTTWELLTNCLPVSPVTASFYMDLSQTRPVVAFEFVGAPDPRTRYLQPLPGTRLPPSVCSEVNCTVFPLILGTRSGLYASTDGGKTFRDLDSVNAPSNNVVAFNGQVQMVAYGSPFTLVRQSSGATLPWITVATVYQPLRAQITFNVLNAEGCRACNASQYAYASCFFPSDVTCRACSPCGPRQFIERVCGTFPNQPAEICHDCRSCPAGYVYASPCDGTQRVNPPCVLAPAAASTPSLMVELRRGWQWALLAAFAASVLLHLVCLPPLLPRPMPPVAEADLAAGAAASTPEEAPNKSLAPAAETGPAGSLQDLGSSSTSPRFGFVPLVRWLLLAVTLTSEAALAEVLYAMLACKPAAFSTATIACLLTRYALLVWTAVGRLVTAFQAVMTDAPSPPGVGNLLAAFKGVNWHPRLDAWSQPPQQLPAGTALAPLESGCSLAVRLAAVCVLGNVIAFARVASDAVSAQVTDAGITVMIVLAVALLADCGSLLHVYHRMRLSAKTSEQPEAPRVLSSASTSRTSTASRPSTPGFVHHRPTQVTGSSRSTTSASQRSDVSSISSPTLTRHPPGGRDTLSLTSAVSTAASAVAPKSDGVITRVDSVSKTGAATVSVL